MACVRRESARPGVTNDRNSSRPIARFLGDIPADRVIFRPAPGTATDVDVIRFLEALQKRLCELIDGNLVEKPMGAREALFDAHDGTLSCRAILATRDPFDNLAISSREP